MILVSYRQKAEYLSPSPSFLPLQPTPHDGIHVPPPPVARTHLPQDPKTDKAHDDVDGETVLLDP